MLFSLTFRELYLRKPGTKMRKRRFPVLHLEPAQKKTRQCCKLRIKRQAKKQQKTKVTSCPYFALVFRDRLDNFIFEMWAKHVAQHVPTADMEEEDLLGPDPTVEA